MTQPRHTTWLAFALLLLLAVDGLAWRAATRARAPLPSVEAFDGALATAMVLSHGDLELRLERVEDGWDVVHPTRHRANPVAVQAVLSVLARGVTPEARVGSDPDGSGLEGGQSVRVQVLSEAGALVDLYVGNDAAGGSTFVRYAGENAVYRTAIGGRERFARPARTWRDPTLWTFDRVDGIAVTRDGVTVDLERVGDRWTMQDDPDFPVDPSLADAVAGALARPVAADVFPADHPVGLDRPQGRLVVRSGTEVRRVDLVVLDEVGYAAIEGQDGVYVLGGRLVHRLLADREAWRDRTLWTLDPASIRELEWIAADGVTRLSRDPRTGTWVNRSGGAVDSRGVNAALAWVARPRAERFVDSAGSGLPGAESLIVVGERTETLQLGVVVNGALDGQDAVYVRAASEPTRVGLVEAALIERLRVALSASR